MINTNRRPPLQVLGALPLPLPYTITAFQLAFGSLLIFLMWATRLHPAPRLSAAQVRPFSCEGKLQFFLSLSRFPPLGLLVRNLPAAT